MVGVVQGKAGFDDDGMDGEVDGVVDSPNAGRDNSLTRGKDNLVSVLTKKKKVKINEMTIVIQIN